MCVGVLLISLALCADAAIGNYQEKALKQHKGSNVEMVRERKGEREMEGKGGR